MQVFTQCMYSFIYNGLSILLLMQEDDLPIHAAP